MDKETNTDRGVDMDMGKRHFQKTGYIVAVGYGKK